MRFVIAGDWHSDLHEHEASRALEASGHEVVAFKWHTYFRPAPGTGKMGQLGLRAQQKYVLGPAVAALNRDFVALAVGSRPDVVFVYRGTHIFGGSLRAIRKALPGCVIVAYNNDDPFGPKQPRYLWRHFLDAIPACDITLAYRHANVAAFLQHGAKRVELLRSWYVADRNYPTTPDTRTREALGADVVFIGHYENDGRLQYLEAIAQQGIHLRVFGPAGAWMEAVARSPHLNHLAPIRVAWGPEYNAALACSRIALCFLSRLNRDTYTRRCFEIPASGAFLLSEYTEDMASLYEEGVEAEFFRSKAEMLEKIRFYLANPAERERIAAAGHAKVRAGGHDVVSRMNTLVGWIEELRSGTTE